MGKKGGGKLGIFEIHTCKRTQDEHFITGRFIAYKIPCGCILLATSLFDLKHNPAESRLPQRIHGKNAGRELLVQFLERQSGCHVCMVPFLA